MSGILDKSEAQYENDNNKVKTHNKACESYKGRQFHHQRVYFVDDNQLKLAKSIKLEIAQPSYSAQNICQSCKALHFFIFRYQAITKTIHDFSQTER